MTPLNKTISDQLDFKKNPLYYSLMFSGISHPVDGLYIKLQPQSGRTKTGTFSGLSQAVYSLSYPAMFDAIVIT